MSEYPEVRRLESLIRRAIDALELDLGGMTVLTEAASGPFVATPLIAAMAGAENVIAVTQDSPYATADEVSQKTSQLAQSLGCQSNLELQRAPAINHAHRADLVTNLNFVRPIDRAFIEKMPEGSAISLMWETWEYRAEDLDLQAACDAGIPVLGTNERDPRLMTFEYVGTLITKLMFEAGLEVFRSRCLLIASGHYGEVACRMLSSLGAEVEHWDPTQMKLAEQEMPDSFWQQLDAVVVAEQDSNEQIIGPEGLDPKHLVSQPTIVHLCGVIDYALIAEQGLCKYPEKTVPAGYMTRTTGDLGPRPVIDLHAGGLKVGESMVRARTQGCDVGEALAFALKHSPAMLFSKEVWQAHVR